MQFSLLHCPANKIAPDRQHSLSLCYVVQLCSEVSQSLMKSVKVACVLCCAVLGCAVPCCAVLCCAVLFGAGLSWAGLGCAGLSGYCVAMCVMYFCCDM